MSRIGKRLIALALCAMMTASVCQLPALNLQAKESSETVSTAKADDSMPVKEIAAGLLLQLIGNIGEDIELENLSQFKDSINTLELMTAEERQDLFDYLRDQLQTVEGMDRLVKVIATIHDPENPDENTLLKKAEEAYDSLSDEEKNELLIIANDKLDKVDEVVDLLKKVDRDDEETIEKARAAYDDLSAGIKPFITTERIRILIEAEEAIIKNNLSKLGDTLGFDDLGLAKEVKEIYEKWTDDQKDIIDTSLKEKLDNYCKAITVIEKTKEAEASDTNSVKEAKKSFEAQSVEQRAIVGKSVVADLKAKVKNSKLTSEEKKFANTLAVTAKTVKVKAKTLEKKPIVLKRKKIMTVSAAKGKVSYKIVKVKKAKFKKYFKVGKKTGNIKLKKKLKKGTYKVKIKVTAAGSTSYKAASKTAILKFKVK